MSAALTPSCHAELVSASIAPDRRKAKTGRKVDPLRIVALDQIDLPLPTSALELFLAQYRTFHIPKKFVASEAMSPISTGESRHGAGAMLLETRDKIGRHADIERPIRPAAQNVDARLLVHRCAGHAEPWMLKQVQHDEMGEASA